MEERALAQAVREIDRHAAAGPWDVRPRLYALVATADLLTHDPALAATLGLDPDSTLTPVEQEQLEIETSLVDALARVAWPAEVSGCALVLETATAPPDSVDADSDAAQMHEGRLTVGVLRDGSRSSALRWRGYDSDADVIRGRDLAPALSDALAATLEP